MEEKDYKPDKVKIKGNEEVTDENGVPNGINTQIECHALTYQDNITLIDLSARNIGILDDKLKLPTNLVQLNLSYNKFIEVPAPVTNLEKLKILNISHNRIEYFDDNPKFCHSLEQLDMSHNQLEGPPYWIWAETPQRLTELNLSNNENITQFFIKYGCYEELLQHSTLVTDISLHNCKLDKFIGLLATFPKAKTICLGSNDYILRSANSLAEVPCKGLDKCCDLRILNVCNTCVYAINPSIGNYENLIEINLAHNNISGLPNEFCNLINLEVCVLSSNKILYLPEDISKLQKLMRLYLDWNEICMLPDTLCELSNLKTLDLYNNNLNEIPVDFSNLEDLDLAQNYFEEPEDSDYLEKKANLRIIHENRYNGRKNVIINQDDDKDSVSEEDDEELFEIFHNQRRTEDPPQIPDPPSSPEDWDSDDYWVPFSHIIIPPATTPWLYFVQQKIKDGSFCPMDMHPVSIVEKIRYEKLCNPQVYYESDGQFDDYSSDNT